MYKFVFKTIFWTKVGVVLGYILLAFLNIFGIWFLYKSYSSMKSDNNSIEVKIMFAITDILILVCFAIELILLDIIKIEII